MVCSAGFAFVSNQTREKAELSLNRHFELVDHLYELRMTVLTTETALAVRLTSPNAGTADTVTKALDVFPARMDQIHNLILASPKPNRRAEKLAHFATIQTGIDGEIQFLLNLEKAIPPAGPVSAELAAQFRDHQPAAQALTQQISEMGVIERKLLDRRLDEIRTARHRDYLLIVLSVILGVATRAIAMYFFHRSVVRRVRQLTENARSMRDGGQPFHEPSGDQDDIGELERELASIGDFLAERRIKP